MFSIRDFSVYSPLILTIEPKDLLEIIPARSPRCLFVAMKFHFNCNTGLNQGEGGVLFTEHDYTDERGLTHHHYYYLLLLLLAQGKALRQQRCG